MKTPLYVKPTEVFFTLHEILKRSFKDEDFLFSFRRRCWVYSNFYMNSYRVKILNREDSLFVIDTSEGLFFLYKDEHPPEINLNHFFKESIVTGTEIEKEEIYPYYITLSENRLNINYLEKKPSSTILIDKSIFEKPFSEKAKSRANSYLDYIIDHPSFQSNIIYSLIENLPDILMPCVVGLVKLEKILNTFYLVAVICSIKNNHKIVEEDDVQEAIRFLDSHLLMGLYYNKLFS